MSRIMRLRCDLPLCATCSQYRVKQNRHGSCDFADSVGGELADRTDFMAKRTATSRHSTGPATNGGTPDL